MRVIHVGHNAPNVSLGIIATVAVTRMNLIWSTLAAPLSANSHCAVIGTAPVFRWKYGTNPNAMTNATGSRKMY